jgi:4-amino-4-deoxy-L-arabinose transferase-like glycosyltransferase
MRRVTTMTLTRDVVLAAPWWKLCWCWVLAILLFFSVPNSKLVGYILPVVPPLALLASLGWERVMAQRPWAGKGFAAVVVLNLGIALTIVLTVGDVTRTARTQDLAQVLACAASPADTVYVSDAYPYDLPLYTQSAKPMVVLGDWPTLRRQAGDGWQRELFEGADFDARAAQVLQPMGLLAQVAQTPGHWYVGRSGSQITANLPGWTLYYQGAGWDLHRSGGLGDLAAARPGRAATAQR